MKLDFKRFGIQPHIEAAAKKSFEKALADHPDETFFAFALTTIGNRQYVSASVNTKENLRSILASADGDGEKLRPYCKWYPNEWGRYEYYGQEDGIWKGVDALLADMEVQVDKEILAAFGLSKFPWERSDRYHRECIALNNERLDHIIETMISALKALDLQGCFGESELRKGRLAFVDVYDDEDSTMIRRRSAREINLGRSAQSLIKEFEAAK